MEKLQNTLRARLTALLMALVCLFGLLPTGALAATPDAIKLERFGMYGISYDSENLGHCTLHEMFFDIGSNKTEVGFCGTKGGGMSNSLIGQTWSNKQEITDPTVKTMLAYYYCHINSQFTDAAHSLNVDSPWSGPWAWYMNAWMQAIIWRYQEGTLNDPVLACAQEMVDVWNSLSDGQYSGIDDELMPGATFLDRAQYILDLGAQGVWGDCNVYLYDFTGAGSSTHPASSVQKVVMGELTINETHEDYNLTIKKVDSTNPSKGLAGATFHVENENGTFSKDVISAADGTCVLTDLNADTYAVTEVNAPSGYQIDNAGPQYVVLPNNGSNSVTVTFTDTPEITGSGSIRKVDADDPSKGLAGAVIKIEGVDNNFTGTYATSAGGYLTDVPWDTMPVGSYTATEITPPEGYTKSPDANKVRQSFHWDGKSDVSLVFENDARVKVQLLKTDESDNPLPGAVFHIIKDGQIIGTEATKADGTITVTNVTEGMYAFVEVSAPAPYACLTDPVIAHVDQATINGGGTVTVTAVNQKLPNLYVWKSDADTGDPVEHTIFTVRAADGHSVDEIETGPDGCAVLENLLPGVYEISEKSVPSPYLLDASSQLVTLYPGRDRTVYFKNHKRPIIEIIKENAVTFEPLAHVPFQVWYASNNTSTGELNDLGVFYTDEDGRIELDGTQMGEFGLRDGWFRVTELEPPTGFAMADPDTQEAFVAAGQSHTFRFQNQPLSAICVWKYDSQQPNVAIEGAVFQIRYLSGNTSGTGGTVIGTYHTSANGSFTVTGLQKGTYIVEVRP